ncbi:MAG: hypothetical protein KGS47_09215 [Chloroflexi bacterium]|jgi:hypothetical protein|nr:hypothetical protein [Chloroflexota bacterium]
MNHPRSTRSVLDIASALHAEPQRDRPAMASVYIFIGAGLCWFIAALLVFVGRDGSSSGSGIERFVFLMIVALAATLSFLPFEQRLGLRSLTAEGASATVLTVIVIVMVPAPNGWLLMPSETPVYVALALSVTFAISAAALPWTYLAGQRLFRHRARRFDIGRARRQAFGIGVWTGLLVLLAGLHMLSAVTAALVLLMVAALELLWLSFIDVGS